MKTSAEPSAIAVRTPNWLGDLMMSTGFLQALLKRFPDVPIDLIVRKEFEEIPLPHRGRILPFDRGQMSAGQFGKRLRGRGYSHFFVLPPSFSSAWMAYHSGVPVRVGHRGGWRKLLLRPAIAARARPRSRHLVLEYMDLLQPWDVSAEQPPPLHLPADDAWCARHAPEAARDAGRYVVIAPGAEYGPAKQWPLKSYKALARGLGNTGRTVIIVGLAKDRDAAEAIISDCPQGLNLCGQTSLLNLIALLGRAALLVSNDSGAMHIGAALGIGQIALFGSSNPTWTAPLNPRAAVIYRGLSCSPCYARVCPLGHTNCLQEITPEAVLDKSVQLLDADGS